VGNGCKDFFPVAGFRDERGNAVHKIGVRFRGCVNEEEERQISYCNDEEQNWLFLSLEIQKLASNGNFVNSYSSLIK